MRWDLLFDDLEAQAEALARAERAGEVDERLRGEVGGLALYDRLRAAVDHPVRLRLYGGSALAGLVRRVGPDWLLIEEDAGREALVVADRITGIRGLTRFSAVPGTAGVVASRLGLRHALRGIARDRASTRIHLTDGSVLDATVDRVGGDYVEAAVHAPGELRRRRDVRDVEVLPLRALVAVRRSS